MLFTPNDFNSSSVVSISGVCHSMPQVWHETVTPLRNGNGAGCSAGEEMVAVRIKAPPSARAEGKKGNFMARFAQSSNETAPHKEGLARRLFGNEFPEPATDAARSGVRACASKGLS